MEGSGSPRKAMEGHGRPQKAIEGHGDVSVLDARLLKGLSRDE